MAAVLLAAGQSQRMGQLNKLLIPLDHEPLIVRTFQNIVASKANPIVIVLGHRAAEIEQTLDFCVKQAQAKGRTILLTLNPDFQQGISSSVKRGIRHLPERTEGVLICLGDMPWVDAAIMDRLIEIFNPQEGVSLCVPTVDKRQGNPILWGSRFFKSLLTLEGDRGAKELLLKHEKEIVRLQTDPRVLLDIDTPEALSLFS